jgi:hypothetical protein
MFSTELKMRDNKGVRITFNFNAGVAQLVERFPSK